MSCGAQHVDIERHDEPRGGDVRPKSEVHAVGWARHPTQKQVEPFERRTRTAGRIAEGGKSDVARKEFAAQSASTILRRRDGERRQRGEIPSRGRVRVGLARVVHGAPEAAQGAMRADAFAEQRPKVCQISCVDATMHEASHQRAHPCDAVRVGERRRRAITQSTEESFDRGVYRGDISPRESG